MESFVDLIAIVAGIVQTVLYCDFFYLYITRGVFFLVIILFLNVNLNLLPNSASWSKA